jgi:5-methylthioribose kinase
VASPGPISNGASAHLDEASLPAYLSRLGLLVDAATARVTRAGEGNLNFVRRVTARSGDSWIVKQARPGVEGFPEFALGPERVLFERRYDEVVRELLAPEQVILPAVEAFDAGDHVLVLEDLGPVASLQEALLSGERPLGVLAELGEFLGRVHVASEPRAAQLVPRFRNAPMRELHGTSLFDAPYAAQGPALPAPLEALVRKVASHPRTRSRLAELRREYFSSAQALVHGDVKCANVLLGARGPRLIDAEFAHVGDPAFDVGTALGHLHLCLDADLDPALRQVAEDALLDAYASTAPHSPERMQRARGYAGVDVIAHVVGPSRLPFLSEPGRAVPALLQGLALLES